MSKKPTQSIEDHLIEHAAKEMANDIDFGVMSELLVDIGWVKVEFDDPIPDFRAKAINNWLHTECSNHWRHRGKMFIFENKNEAALFKLTWS